MMTLTDTIKLMESNDHKERFAGEFFQLSIRITSLTTFIQKYKMGMLDFTPNCTVDMLEQQLISMMQLQRVLSDRANVEQIDFADYLPKED
jgi:hypothetical protein